MDGDHVSLWTAQAPLSNGVARHLRLGTVPRLHAVAVRLALLRLQFGADGAEPELRRVAADLELEIEDLERLLSGE